MDKEKEIEEMTDREKQIEEIGLLMVETYRSYNKQLCLNWGMPSKLTFIAEALYNAGYGNVKQYQEEIERLETELSHREQDLIHADEKVFYREVAVKLDEDKIKKQAVKEFAEKFKAEIRDLPKTALTFSIRHHTPQLIDSVYKELYGADE